MINIASMKASEFQLSDIENIVKSKLPLTNSLYFVDSSLWKPHKLSNDPKLLKIIAALANNNGHTLIVGIKTRKNRAWELDPVELSDFSTLWLANVIRAHIMPQLHQVEIKLIYSTPSSGFIVMTYMTNNRPYMFIDGRYYSIFNQTLYYLSEDEVRRLYALQHAPKVEFVGLINTQGVALLDNGMPKEIHFYPKFLIRNAGNAVEKEYKTEIWIPSYLHDAENSPLQMFFSRFDGLYSIFSVPSKISLFQKEIYTVAEAKITLRPENIHRFLTEHLRVIIYYSQGMTEHELKLSETFSYQSQQIDTLLFGSSKKLKK